jgi:UDP-3-O-[3-hydroxymyristoyl] N-acetylglucosamine deacetylase
MDGLPESLTLQTAMKAQRTIGAPIFCVGVGLHSGRKTNLALHPLPAGSGIIFRRTDLDPACGPIDIPARFDHVIDTRLCTVIGHPQRPECRVGTIEHLMAALAGLGIDNVLVEIDAAEVPILDGSSADFTFLIDCAGVVEQQETMTEIEVLRAVRVEHGEAFAELRPNAFGFDMAMTIEFAASAIGRQGYAMRLSPEAFRAEVADCRTFTQVQEVEAMQAAGLALGGSLDNAIVVDGAKILNPNGLRRPDEFVRHKLLDAVGDLALAGAPLRARFVGHRTGHMLNNKLLRALFADDANWRLVIGGGQTSPLWQPAQRAAAAA